MQDSTLAVQKEAVLEIPVAAYLESKKVVSKGKLRGSKSVALLV